MYQCNNWKMMVNGKRNEKKPLEADKKVFSGGNTSGEAVPISRSLPALLQNRRYPG